MMANSLQLLFQAIAHARNEQELRGMVMASAGEYFAAHRWGLFFFAQLPPDAKNLPNNLKIALSVEKNPILRYLIEHHAVVHEELLLPPGVWEAICPRSDHAHVMAGPIVGNGSLLGAIGFTRVRGNPAFNAREMTDLSALCLHLSTWFVSQRSPSIYAKISPSNRLNFASINRLTTREIEIAELVAQGLTNAEIGAALWITENSVKQALKRMFRKLEVSSRAQMVGLLCSN